MELLAKFQTAVSKSTQLGLGIQLGTRTRLNSQSIRQAPNRTALFEHRHTGNWFLHWQCNREKLALSFQPSGSLAQTGGWCVTFNWRDSSGRQRSRKEWSPWMDEHRLLPDGQPEFVGVRSISLWGQYAVCSISLWEFFESLSLPGDVLLPQNAAFLPRTESLGFLLRESDSRLLLCVEMRREKLYSKF